MSEKTIVNRLNKLAYLKADRAIITATEDAEIKRLQAVADAKAAEIDAQIKELDQEIRDQAIDLGPGNTIPGELLQAITYISESWNGTMLHAWAINEPYLLEAMTQKIVVQIKAVAKKKGS